MINLLNPEDQKQLKSARLNVRLLRFVMLLLVVVAGVGFVYGVGFWMADNERIIAERQFEESELELKKYAEVAQAAAKYKSDLAIAKQILGKGVTYSELLTSIGAIMPSGTIVESMSLSVKNTASKNGETAIGVRGHSYDDILRIKQAFETSKLFSNVRISRTNVPEKPAEKGIAATYRYEATLQVVVNPVKEASR